MSVKSGQLHRCRSGCARPRSPLAPRCVHMRARKSPHHGVAVFSMPLSSPNGAGSSPEPATGVPRGDCPDEGRDHRRPVNGVGLSRRRAAVSKPLAAAGEVVRRLAGLHVLRTCGNSGGSPPGSRSSRPALGTSCAPVRSGPAIDARAQARHYRGQDRVRLAPHRAAHPGIDPGCCQIPAGRSEPPSAVAVGKSRSAWCCTAKLPASMSFMPARSVEHGSASGSAFASRTHPQLFAAANPGLQAS
jgi:hypothetical protein